MRKILFTLTAFMFLVGWTTTAQGQIVKKVVKSTVNHLSSQDFTGTWKYEGIDIKFKSSNLLKKAGGNVAANKMEKNLDESLRKMGFEPGITTFTFNSDSTFTNVTNGRKMSGKYTYDSSTDYITLKYMGHVPIKAKVSGSGSKMSLLFEASGFLSMVTFIGSHSGISIIKGVTSILNSYDGMMVGMELRKEK